MKSPASQKPSKPKIAIIGAGAIGSLVGGLLARQGEDVLLIGPQAHVAAIQRDGLKVDGVQGEFIVRPAAAVSLEEQPDIAVIAVKSQDVRVACEMLRPWGADIPVVMIQNGLAAAETAAEYFSREQIITAIFMLNAQFMAPGRVTYIKPGAVVVGHVFGLNGSMTRRIQALLAKGFQTTLSDNIQGVQYTKLFINALGNALDALTGMPMGEYRIYPVMWRLGISILREARGLIRLAGVNLAPLPGIPVSLLERVSWLPLPLAAWVLKQVTGLKGDPKIMTSTLQSLLKGKKTEIDFLHGEFVRLGQRLGVPTPFNAKVVELIHAIEETGEFFAPERLAVEFGLGKG